MVGKGLPIRHGFTITTEAFKRFLENDREVPDGLMQEVKEAIAEIEQVTGKWFASQMGPPLLFTVSAGSPVRMSGLMDDIHGFGLDERGVQQLAERTSDARFAGCEYLTFIETLLWLFLCQWAKWVCCHRLIDDGFCALQRAGDRDETRRLIQCDQQFAYGFVCCYSWVAPCGTFPTGSLFTFVTPRIQSSYGCFPGGAGVTQNVNGRLGSRLARLIPDCNAVVGVVWLG
jgi:hypothetical protein